MCVKVDASFGLQLCRLFQLGAESRVVVDDALDEGI
jgi:hypothetical protein